MGTVLEKKGQAKENYPLTVYFCKQSTAAGSDKMTLRCVNKWAQDLEKQAAAPTPVVLCVSQKRMGMFFMFWPLSAHVNRIAVKAVYLLRDLISKVRSWILVPVEGGVCLYISEVH